MCDGLAAFMAILEVAVSMVMVASLKWLVGMETCSIFYQQAQVCRKSIRKDSLRSLTPLPFSLRRVLSANGRIANIFAGWKESSQLVFLWHTGCITLRFGHYFSERTRTGDLPAHHQIPISRFLTVWVNSMLYMAEHWPRFLQRSYVQMKY